MENRKQERQLDTRLQRMAHLVCIQKHTSQMISSLVDEMSLDNINSKRKDDDK